MTRCLFKRDCAMAYSATTVFPADVCADTNTDLIFNSQLWLMEYFIFQEHVIMFADDETMKNETGMRKNCTLRV